MGATKLTTIAFTDLAWGVCYSMNKGKHYGFEEDFPNQDDHSVSAMMGHKDKDKKSYMGYKKKKGMNK